MLGFTKKIFLVLLPSIFNASSYTKVIIVSNQKH